MAPQKIIITFLLIAFNPSLKALGEGVDVTREQMGALNQYSTKMGKDLVKNYLKLDLDKSIYFDLRGIVPRFRSKTKVGDPTLGSIAGSSLIAANTPQQPFLDLQVKVEQDGDALRMRNDPRDIPFAFRFSSMARVIPNVLEIQTYAYLPLSYRDELKVGSAMQVPNLELPLVSRLMRQAGFWAPWVVDSYYTTRMNDSSLDSGFGTAVFGDWSVAYRHRYRFTDGEQKDRFSLGVQF